MAIEVKHYSLIDYGVTITAVTAGLEADISQRGVVLGGAQSYLNRISVAQEVANVTKKTDVTGSTVFEFSNNHSGTVTLEINFVSDALDTLLKAVRTRYRDMPSKWHEARFNIDIYRYGASGNMTLVSCIDCMLTSPRALFEVSAEVGARSYEFLAASIQERTLSEVMLEE